MGNFIEVLGQGDSFLRCHEVTLGPTLACLWVLDLFLFVAYINCATLCTKYSRATSSKQKADWPGKTTGTTNVALDRVANELIGVAILLHGGIFV